MKIDVIFSANLCEDISVKNKNAVVIDVLRATSVITTALHNGALFVKTFVEIDDTLKYAEKTKATQPVVLGGERHALKIDGFECGNSPLEYDRDLVQGKIVAMTTTNGTNAIEKAKNANHLYLMCFLNIKAVKNQLVKDDEDVVFVCAGTNGDFSTDDVLCAAICIDYLSSSTKVELSDAAYFIRDFYRQTTTPLNTLLSTSAHYKTLLNNGYLDDLDYCLTLNILDVLPYYDNGCIYKMM